MRLRRSLGRDRLVSALSLAGVLLLSGCVSPNVAELVNALAKDGATACARAYGPPPYNAVIEACRVNSKDAGVKVDRDGMLILHGQSLKNNLQ